MCFSNLNEIRERLLRAAQPTDNEFNVALFLSGPRGSF
jgi:hypothetical protein